MDDQKILTYLQRVQAIADTGLLYAKDGYDIERYEELKEISLQLIEQLTDQPLEKLKQFYLPLDTYPTPKVDIRALVLNEQKEILMVQESQDQKWALPGGWADIGHSPKEVIEKEIREETGIIASTDRLLAVFDKKCHPHPPQAEYVYKLVFLAKAQSSEIKPGFDILNARYYRINELPNLSENRILQSQIELVFKWAEEGILNPYVD